MKINVKKMLNYFLTFVFIISVNININAAVNVSKYLDKTIMTVGGEKITFAELKRVYDKSYARGDILFENLPIDTVNQFLNVYANFKLKVLDGIKKGYDKDSAIVAEVEYNKKILAESFLLDEEVINPAIKEFLEKRRSEKKIAVILCHYDPNSDTSEAYKKINAALQEIKNGATFEYAAKKYSSDTTYGKDGGIMPMYITGLLLQKNIEDAIYNLKVGEYTQKPIKTGYAYFLIKLLEDVPRIFVDLSHILIPYSNANTDLGPIIKDSVEAQKLADSIYNALQKGANFAELAKKYSADKNNADSGGYIGTYSRSGGFIKNAANLVPEAEEAVYSIKDGEVTRPIPLRVGIDIVRRDSTISFPEAKEINIIKINYEKNSFKSDKIKFYDSIAVAKCGFKLNNATLNELLQNVDTTKSVLDTNFYTSIPVALKDKILYSFSGKDYSVDWFANQLLDIPVLKTTSTNNKGYREAIHKLIEPEVIVAATENITKTHPKFNEIMNEFMAGIILFKSDAENIWQGLNGIDTVRAKNYYDTTKMDLIKPLEYDISEIYVINKEKIDSIDADIDAGKITFDSAATLYTQRSSARDKKGRIGVIDTKHKLGEIANNLGLKQGEISNPFKYEKGYSIIKMNEIIPERKKTFDEALPLISTNVQLETQEYLTNQWIARLRKEYKVKIDEKLVKEIWN